MSKLLLIKFCIIFIFSCVISFESKAQLKFLIPKNIPDTNYIHSYNHQINARVFTINKFNNFTLSGNSFNNHESIKFSSNKSMGIGFGAVYKIFNFNLSIGLPKLRKFQIDYDKTRAIDFQTSMYGRSWVFDLYGQAYKGFYSQNLSNPFQLAQIERTDIIMNNLGVTAHYLTNNTRFSYRAFRINDELQFRSSGTFLISFSAFTGQIHSNQNKGFISDEFFTADRKGDVRKKFYFQLGPGGGYAYNFVIRRNFFILTSASIRIMYDINREFTTGHNIYESAGWNWGYTTLSAIGYQNSRWGINASVINTFNTIESYNYSQSYQSNTGYFKMTFIYRIPEGRFSRKITAPFDYLLRK